MKPVSWIPNEVGFKLTAVLNNNTKIATEVIMKDFGPAGLLHGLKGLNIADIKGWYPQPS